MDTKSKMLMVAIFLAFFASISFTFYKTIVLRDFDVMGAEEEVLE